MKQLRAEIEATEKGKVNGLRNEIKNLQRKRRASTLTRIFKLIKRSESQETDQGKESELLKEKSEKLKQLNFKFVEFNAWRHDKAEALWAAFALEFLQQISTPKTFFEIATLNGFKHLNLSRKRFNWREKWLDGFRLIALSAFFIILAILLPITFVAKFGDITKLSEQVLCNLSPEKPEENDEPQDKGILLISASLPGSELANIAIPPTNSHSLTQLQSTDQSQDDCQSLGGALGFLLAIGGVAGSATGAAKLIGKVIEIIGDPKNDLKQYLERPDYDSQVAFIEKFHADFKKIVTTYAGTGNKVYVFIDDRTYARPLWVGSSQNRA